VLAHALALSAPQLLRWWAKSLIDQSIYAWRGADIKNILDFEKDYSDRADREAGAELPLDETILHIAGQPHRAQPSAQGQSAVDRGTGRGEKAKLFQCQDEYDEANIVAAQMKEAHEKLGFPLGPDGDLLSHERAVARDGRCAAQGEPAVRDGPRGTEFYNRKEIKDVLAYLRVIANANDEVSLTRIMNVPTRGLGDTSVKQMQAHAIATGKTLFEAMQDAASITGLSTRAAIRVGRLSSW